MERKITQETLQDILFVHVRRARYEEIPLFEGLGGVTSSKETCLLFVE